MWFIMLGGALGCYLRYTISKWFDEQPWGQILPVGTLAVNVIGCFLLGVTAVLVLEYLPPAHQNWYLLLGTGFCGGLTTFSTFSWETYKLIRDGSWWYGIANICISCIAGILSILIAVALMSLVLSHHKPARHQLPSPPTSASLIKPANPKR
jgi:CrcB protein